MKSNKKWKHRFGNLNGKVEPYFHHLDLRRIDDLDDEGFTYLMASVRGVNMLDLNETEITNESIKLLTGLEFVKELQVKGCRLDNTCIPDLNKITSLELLHLKHTAVTIDGLLHLHALTNLKTLLFSADDVEAIKDKMMQLKAMHPNCEFIIDGKPYYFDNVERFIYAVKAHPYTYNLKIKNELPASVWSNWIIKPSDNYFETEMQGPYLDSDIEWIEVNPVEERKEGRLVPVNEINHTNEIVKELEELSIPYMIVEEIIRIYIVK